MNNMAQFSEELRAKIERDYAQRLLTRHRYRKVLRYLSVDTFEDYLDFIQTAVKNCQMLNDLEVELMNVVPQVLRKEAVETVTDYLLSHAAYFFSDEQFFPSSPEA